jgi:hypothetical protein
VNDNPPVVRLFPEIPNIPSLFPEMIPYEILSPSISLPLIIRTRAQVNAFSGTLPVPSLTTGGLSFTLLIVIVTCADHVPPLPSSHSTVKTYQVVVS